LKQSNKVIISYTVTQLKSA